MHVRCLEGEDISQGHQKVAFYLSSEVMIPVELPTPTVPSLSSPRALA